MSGFFVANAAAEAVILTLLAIATWWGKLSNNAYIEKHAAYNTLKVFERSLQKRQYQEANALIYRGAKISSFNSE